MTTLWICTGLFLAWYTFLLVSNQLSYPKLLELLKTGTMKRTQVYARMISGLWLFALVAVIPLVLGLLSPASVGVLPRSFPCPAWLRVIASILTGLWFLFLLAQNAILFRNFMAGKASTQQLPERLSLLLPRTMPDRRIWVGAAVTAGLCEELMFRGFLLHALTALFPALPLLAALGVASLLFGAGHLYQGPKEAWKPLVIGLVYGAFYLAFGTIWPCVALHALQDLEAAWAVPVQADEAGDKSETLEQ